MYSERSILHERDVVAGAELWKHDDAQRAHVHEFMEIVIVKSGTAVHRMRSGSCPITTGSVLLVRPGQWHAYDDPRDLQIWNLYIPYKTLAVELTALRSHPVLAAFTSARVTAAGALAPGPPGQARGHDGVGVPTFEVGTIEPYLAELAQPSHPAGRSLSRLGHLLVVLDALAPAFRSLKPGQNVAPTHPAVIAATELLDSEPENPWSLADLAERVHVSTAYLCRLFTRELGISPLHYLERHRLELTAQLLMEGGMSMSQISSTAGWSDSNYMTRRFRAAHGMSPTRYREVFQRRPRHANPGTAIGG